MAASTSRADESVATVMWSESLRQQQKEPAQDAIDRFVSTGEDYTDYGWKEYIHQQAKNAYQSGSSLLKRKFTQIFSIK